jgi:hypothetical protein
LKDLKDLKEKQAVPIIYDNSTNSYFTIIIYFLIFILLMITLFSNSSYLPNYMNNFQHNIIIIIILFFTDNSLNFLKKKRNKEIHNQREMEIKKEMEYHTVKNNTQDNLIIFYEKISDIISKQFPNYILFDYKNLLMNFENIVDININELNENDDIKDTRIKIKIKLNIIQETIKLINSLKDKKNNH